MRASVHKGEYKSTISTVNLRKVAINKHLPATSAQGLANGLLSHGLAKVFRQSACHNVPVTAHERVNFQVFPKAQDQPYQNYKTLFIELLSCK